MSEIDNEVSAAQPTAFELVGGEARVRELVDRFYDLMDLEAEFAGIRALHPERIKNMPVAPGPLKDSLQSMAASANGDIDRFRTSIARSFF